MPPPPKHHQQHASDAAAAKSARQNARAISMIKQKATKKGAVPEKLAPLRPATTATAAAAAASPPPRRPPPPPPPPSTTATTSSKALPRLLPAPLAARLEGAHKPAALVLASSLLMQASVDIYETGIFFSAGAAEAAAAEAATAAAAAATTMMTSSSSSSTLLPGTAALAGAALGLLYACVLLPLAARTAWASPARPLRAVVTGGSKGLGKALAREHLFAGDSVVVAARDWGRLLRAARELSEETGAELVLLPADDDDDDGGGGEEEEEEEEEDSMISSSSPSSVSSSLPPRPTITPIACDVSDPASVTRLVSESLKAFEKGGKGKRGQKGGIDCFYNNAGDSGSLRGFRESDPETLARVVSTNLLGAVLCTRAAMEAMMTATTEQQEGSSSFGHIFLVEGAGSDGLATPGYAAYGATKAAIAQLAKSLAAEAASAPASAATAKESSLSSTAAAASSASPPPSPARVGFHALSPGLVLTPLLLDGVFPPPPMEDGAGNGGGTDKREPSSASGSASFEAKARALAFDALCEHPETAAAFLVPRARSLVASGDPSSAVRYLTPLRAAARLLSAPFRRGRHFDAETAAPRWETRDGERLFGPKNGRRSRRERARAARRGSSLALSFAASSAALFVVLVTSGSGGGGGGGIF